MRLAALMTICLGLALLPPNLHLWQPLGAMEDPASLGRPAAVPSSHAIRGDRPPPLADAAGAAESVHGACRSSLVAASLPLDPVHVDVLDAGPVSLVGDGFRRAMLDVQITYAEGGRPEVRRSIVGCLLDRDGRVVAIEDIGGVESEPAAAERSSPVFDDVRRPPGETDGTRLVSAFYWALGNGDGETASRYVIPEKRIDGPLSGAEISRYFGAVARPLRVQRIIKLGAESFEVRYSYGISRRDCAGAAQVMLARRGDSLYIESIHAVEECS
jgi:hypothetical protein